MNSLLPATRLNAAAIVRASHSSFVPAFRLMSAERRRDIETLYAFCRTADEIADAPGHSRADRHAALEAWRKGFREPGQRGLPDNLRDLIARRGLDIRLFLALLDGIATDLAPPVRMAAHAELDLYCHRVAGTVGQLCLPIFGADPRRSAAYAETLGRALQYTNIIRDTASDLQRGRIYYPLDELAAAGVADNSFPAGAGEYLKAFAREANDVYRSAEEKLPHEDRAALRPARIMASIYHMLLRKMQRDGLRVMEKRYRLSALQKLLAIGRTFFGGQAPRRVA